MATSPNAIVQRLLYRSYLRMTKKMINEQKSFWLQPFPHIREFQMTSLSSGPDSIDSIIKLHSEKFHFFLKTNLKSRFIDGVTLKSLIELARESDDFDLESDSISGQFEILKFLNAQVHLSKSTSIKMTNDIRVISSAVYQPRYGQDIAGDRYYYRVTIENNSKEDVQLLGRYWLFSAPGRANSIVPKYSFGVVGQQPVLPPGFVFQYMSVTDIMGVEAALEKTPPIDVNTIESAVEGSQEDSKGENVLHGSMEGSFLMRRLSTNERFEVLVDKCELNPQVKANTNSYHDY